MFGSAYERFTASQIKRLYDYERTTYDQTVRISLISSFVASLFLGKIAPIEIADASGMNLMDIGTGKWDQDLLKLCGGDALAQKLGDEPATGGTNLGQIASWWVKRYGFNDGSSISFLPFDSLTRKTQQNASLLHSPETIHPPSYRCPAQGTLFSRSAHQLLCSSQFLQVPNHRCAQPTRICWLTQQL